MQAGEWLAGRYRLDARLGRGGMGEVWRGFDASLDRDVAVKLLPDAPAEDETVARFRREALIGARLQHPGITVVHDVGRHDDRLFLVMELLHGSDLAALLARSPGGLPVPEAVTLAAQAAEALAAAHAGQVVHRDLKPANLFLLADGRLKVCDFGIARAGDLSTALTATGWMIGTPPYMAPEQWRGEPVDARCDLYALGCVVFELLTGSPPFGNDAHPLAVMRRHVEDAPPRLRERRPDAPAALDRLVGRLLAKDPRGRPESADAVAVALRELGGAPVVPRVRTPEPATAEENRELIVRLVDKAERELGDALPLHDHRVVAVYLELARIAAHVDVSLSERVLGAAERLMRELARRDRRLFGDSLSLIQQMPDRWAPVHAARLLNEALQSTFTLTGTDRDLLFNHILRALAFADHERAAALAPRLPDHPNNDFRGEIYAAAAAAVAGSDEPRAEAYRRLIKRAFWRRTADVSIRARVAAAAENTEDALRSVERLGEPGDRVEAVCELAVAWAGTRPEESGELLERAERYLELAVRDRIAELRETAAAASERSALVEAARAQNTVDRILGSEPGERLGDQRLDSLRLRLDRARQHIEAVGRNTVTPQTAREQLDSTPGADPVDRASHLASVAGKLLPPSAEPLPEALAPRGATPPPRHSAPTVVAAPAHRPDSRRPPGTELWRSDRASVTDAAATADVVLWTAEDTAGALSAATGRFLWSAEGDNGVYARPKAAGRTLRGAVAADLFCVAVGGVGAPGVRVVARDVRDGRVRWWTDLPDAVRDEAGNPFLVHGDFVVLYGRDFMTALHRDTGRVAWTARSTVAGPRHAAAGHGRIAVVDGPEIRCLDLATGRPCWSRSRDLVPEGTAATSLLHLRDGTSVLALDAETGVGAWRYEVLGPPGTGLPHITDGRLYATAGNPSAKGDRLYALDAATGRLLWDRTVANHNSRSCRTDIVGVQGGLLVVKAADGGTVRLGRTKRPPFLQAYDARTGKPCWTWENAGISHRPAVLSGGGVVLPCPYVSAIALPSA
ncbi:protein kinase [Streptomyces sp. NPDC051940]|uniref:protein kinase domain-containing protein n=1 Tax=Streptomyces sp. NPDC051940 TaxID=3155675 RepID=UPI0034264444